MKRSIKILITLGIGAVLLIALIGAVFISPVGMVFSRSLSGGGPAAWAAAWHSGAWGGGSGLSLPSGLQGLTSIPADQRFAHFDGVQVNLTDQNNQPLSIHVTPGKVTAASATSLNIQANDGSSQVFTLDAQTLIHTQAAKGATPTTTLAAASNLANGDEVLVVTLNNSTTATAVIDGGASGFLWSGRGGW